MTARPRRLVGTRPRDAAERWVGTGQEDVALRAKGETYTARLTIDVTPALRGRIKVAPFERGITVADMLRALLDERFGASTDGAVRTTP